MAQVQVQRLHLRGPPASAARAAFRIEDALRTEVVDDGRLVLIRRLALGAMASGSRPRAFPDQLAGAYRHMVGQALHGGEDGAADSDCVWFRDAGEARQVLVRLLAAGRSPRGWFWKLAVPDWRDRPLDAWVGGQVRTHVDKADGAALAELVAALVASSATGVLVDALVAAIARGAPALRPPLFEPPDAPQYKPATGDTTGQEAGGIPPPPAPERVLAHRVAAALGTMPSALFTALAQVAGTSGMGAALRLIAEAMIVRQLPELALSPALRRTYAEEWVRQLADPDRRRTAASRPQAVAPHRYRDVRASEQASPQRHAVPKSDDPSIEAPIAALPDILADERPATTHRPGAIAEDPYLDPEQYSPAAGLLLVIVPLLQLGWREWLSDRADLIGDAPTARLIHAIARHYRIAGDDPVDRLFAPPPEDRTSRDWLVAWRIGLDRWLRRRARVKLAGLVHRPGWITHGEDGVTIRFPADAADIRLRRLALDRDPGWVDWLGMSVRFAYRDRAEDAWRGAGR